MTQPEGLSSHRRSVKLNAKGRQSTRGWDGGLSPRQKSANAQLDKPPSEWTAFSLATYLTREVTKVRVRAPGRGDKVEFGGLGAFFKRWMSRDDIRPEEIKAMIDWFCHDPQPYMVRGCSVHQSFLKRYRTIWDDSATYRQGQLGEAKCDDEDYWLAPTESDVPQDEAYWLGRSSR